MVQDNDSRGQVTVIPQRDRKLRKFGEKSDNFLSWEIDASGAISGPGLTGAEKGEFLYTKLYGSARLEIKCRGESLRQDPEAVLKALREVFGGRGEAAKITKEFWARDQGKTETLTEYSHALMGVLDHLKWADQEFEDLDELLRKKFKSGVRDQNLRWELTRFMKDNPEATFIKVREDALAWEREGGITDSGTEAKAKSAQVKVDSAKVSVTEAGVQDQVMSALERMNSHVTDLQKALMEQQKQMAAVLAMAQHNMQPSVQPSTQVSSQPIPQASAVYDYNERNCYFCHHPGHMKRDCAKYQGWLAKKNQQQQPTEPQQKQDF